jgi:hypothetical protein
MNDHILNIVRGLWAKQPRSRTLQVSFREEKRKLTC